VFGGSISDPGVTDPCPQSYQCLVNAGVRLIAGTWEQQGALNVKSSIAGTPPLIERSHLQPLSVATALCRARCVNEWKMAFDWEGQHHCRSWCVTSPIITLPPSFRVRSTATHAQRVTLTFSCTRQRCIREMHHALSADASNQGAFVGEWVQEGEVYIATTGTLGRLQGTLTLGELSFQHALHTNPRTNG
jgi:hypothetical protein